MGLFIRSNFFSVIILIDEKPEIGTVSAECVGGGVFAERANDSLGYGNNGGNGSIGAATGEEGINVPGDCVPELQQQLGRQVFLQQLRPVPGRPALQHLVADPLSHERQSYRQAQVQHRSAVHPFRGVGWRLLRRVDGRDVPGDSSSAGGIDQQQGGGGQFVQGVLRSELADGAVQRRALHAFYEPIASEDVVAVGLGTDKAGRMEHVGVLRPPLPRKSLGLDSESAKRQLRKLIYPLYGFFNNRQGMGDAIAGLYGWINWRPNEAIG